MTPSVRLSVLRRLEARLLELDGRLDADATAWPDYLATVNAMVSVLIQLRPEAGGGLLTTEQLAERLGVTSKTLLRHAKAGAVKPAMRKGKLIRWRADEVAR